MSIPESVCSEFVPVSRDSSVFDAVKVMAEHDIGSVVVVENNAIAGIFTERDLMKRVVLPGLPPADTKIGDVMTSSVATIDVSATLVDLLSMMDRHHIRHLPILKDGAPHAMTTMRKLQKLTLTNLRKENETLAALIMTDGPGG